MFFFQYVSFLSHLRHDDGLWLYVWGNDAPCADLAVTILTKSINLTFLRSLQFSSTHWLGIVVCPFPLCWSLWICLLLWNKHVGILYPPISSLCVSFRVCVRACVRAFVMLHWNVCGCYFSREFIAFGLTMWLDAFPTWQTSELD